MPSSVMTIQDAIIQIHLRADKWDDDSLVKSFVNLGPIIPILNSENNQIIFGRRGTGKTHILRYFQSQKITHGDCAIYIDLRKIGSSNSVYSSPNFPIEQRALSFFIDIIKIISEGLVGYITSSDSNKESYLHEVSPLIEELHKTWTKKAISGTVTTEEKSVVGYSENESGGFTINASPSLNISTKIQNINNKENKLILTGSYYSYINFLEASSILQQIATLFSPHKIWLIFDEFAELCSEIQIILSDILRKVISPVKGITFKIGSIEHRSIFKLQQHHANYIGLELGADVSTINIDDLLVFGNNHASSLTFFRDILFQRINTVFPKDKNLSNSNDLIQKLFTQEKGFEELVMAAEGVPRDFFSILSKAILLDYYNPLSIPLIRKAALQWFAEDKRSSIQALTNANNLLDWIISDIINERQARAFMLKSDCQDQLINSLYDARILHIIKTNVSSRDTPGARYNVYSIDYGCYVDLINTQRAPKGLFENELEDGTTEYIDVPRDDYRSIRRAILDITKFYGTSGQHD